MNTGAQIQSIVSTINGLIAKVIELERVQKNLETTVNDLPTKRDIEQMIASQLVGSVDRAAVVQPPAPSPAAATLVPPPRPQASEPVQGPTSIEGILSGGASSGAPLDDIELVPVEKKKIIKKKK